MAAAPMPAASDALRHAPDSRLQCLLHVCHQLRHERLPLGLTQSAQHLIACPRSRSNNWRRVHHPLHMHARPPPASCSCRGHSMGLLVVAAPANYHGRSLCFHFAGRSMYHCHPAAWTLQMQEASASPPVDARTAESPCQAPVLQQLLQPAGAVSLALLFAGISCALLRNSDSCSASMLLMLFTAATNVPGEAATASMEATLQFLLCGLSARALLVQFTQPGVVTVLLLLPSSSSSKSRSPSPGTRAARHCPETLQCPAHMQHSR